MTTKEKVLELLKDNSNLYISGQDIADKLFLTRAGVWKAIKSLRSEGYNIEAVNNKGYCLISEGEALSAGSIRAELVRISGKNSTDIFPEILTFDEVGSTNDLAREYGINGQKGDLVIISDCQTKGRGRRGRNFYSPKGTGLYISFLLHPQIEISKATLLTCMSAVAVCRALDELCDVKTSIKWVNDIFLNDKKISGILTEGYTSIETGTLEYVIVGIGINVVTPKDGFPADIKKTAGAVYKTGTAPEHIKNKLCAAIISKFYELYNSGEASYKSEYRSRSNLIGHYVKVNPTLPESSLKGYALVKDIDDDCHLVVEYENGTTETLSNGEVSVVKY